MRGTGLSRTLLCNSASHPLAKLDFYGPPIIAITCAAPVTAVMPVQDEVSRERATRVVHRAQEVGTHNT